MNGAFWPAVAKGVVVAIGAGLALGVWNMSSNVTILTTKFEVFAQQVVDHEMRIRKLELISRPPNQ